GTGGAYAQYAPAMMILEAAPDNTRAFREQRGRQRIPGKARGRFSVEVKTKRLRAFDETAARQAEGLGATHGPAAPCRASVADSTARISCVRVLRVTTSQASQPPAWYQNSRCAPAVLSR